MMRNGTGVRVAVIGTLLLLVGAAARGQQSGRFHDVIAAVSAGADSAQRRAAIVGALAQAGIEYRVEEFSFPNFAGANIIARIAGGNPRTILIGAHYDRVSTGQGAVDNAASCAVLFELAKAFKSRPLAHYSVDVVFFDLEEAGLVGSQAYVAAHRGAGLPAEVVNLDIFGYGDTLFANVAPLDGAMASAFRTAAQDGAIPVRVIGPVAQYPASDHRIFISAGVETLGLALIDGTEIDGVLGRGGPPPRIMSIIHTPRDTIDQVRSADMEKAFPVVERMIRLLDDAAR